MQVKIVFHRNDLKECLKILGKINFKMSNIM